ncbi:MAG TPA: ATP-binding protein [Candidatus Limnocylindrales bacterium]|nr:ATP-binding protein [Candidatus Limnocylindrales bacterium]
MDLTRPSHWVYGILAAFWLLVGVWQAEEHFRFREAAKSNLSNRSKDIANTVSACIRGMRFRGAVRKERLETVLDELVNGGANDLVKSTELLSIVLLNAAGETVASAGRPIDFTQKEILQRGERWGQRIVTFVNPVDLGVSLTSEGTTNPTVVLPPPRDLTNGFREPRPFRSDDGGRPPGPPPEFERFGSGNTNEFAGERPPRGEFRPRRPPWLRGMDEKEFQSLIEKQALHGLVLAMSTDAFQAASVRDFWLRTFIILLATVAAAGSGLAWRNLVKSSDLQIRLVRASELNTHLKEMNLAAAGLAHETRNPLNIIRGRAQMISNQTEFPPEIREKGREIVNEVDKVAAQLNEFINYSRPREVRRARLTLGTIINEVVRALSYDLEEKKIRLQVLPGESITVEADEQLFRQALFNLLINAVQAVEPGGEIHVAVARQNGLEASLDVRDNGPGVPPERRSEIFKPYFTTQKTGTGLGLAVVQQIVLAHGWEIQCLPNDPKGAVFRITHLKIAA